MPSPVRSSTRPTRPSTGPAYDLIGFGSTFQNIASLALAKRVKAEHPELKIVFGGYNWTGEMGVELHRCFPFVDFVLSGEADETLPALLRLVTGEDDPAGFATLPGLVYREDGETRVGPPARPVAGPRRPAAAGLLRLLRRPRLQRLRRRASAACCRSRPRAAAGGGSASTASSARTTATTMAFRAKSPQRVLDEIRTLVERWRVGSVCMLDSMIAPDYFETVLPRIQEECGDIELFWEVRPTITREQVATSGRGGRQAGRSQASRASPATCCA